MSYTLALEAGRWQDAPPDDFEVSFERIHGHALWLRRCESEWLDLMETTTEETLLVDYEDLASSPAVVLRQVFDHLKVVKADNIELDAGTVVQRTARSTQLRNDYVRWLEARHATSSILQRLSEA